MSLLNIYFYYLSVISAHLLHRWGRKFNTSLVLALVNLLIILPRLRLLPQALKIHIVFCIPSAAGPLSLHRIV